MVVEIPSRGRHIRASAWLTCSAATRWTVWAVTPPVWGSSHCWSGCRCDSAALARSACWPGAQISASSAPAPAYEPQKTQTSLRGGRSLGHQVWSRTPPYLICSVWWFWAGVAFLSVASEWGAAALQLDLCFFSVLPAGGEGVFVLPLRAFGEELFAGRVALLPSSSWGRISVDASALPVLQGSSSTGLDDGRWVESADRASCVTLSTALSMQRICRQSTVCPSSWAPAASFWHWYSLKSVFSFHFEPVSTGRQT